MHQQYHDFCKNFSDLQCHQLMSLVFPFPEMSLKDYENRLEDSVLSLEEATTYFLQVAHGVDRAHSLGIFHNDIKSSNVLLFANSNGKNKYTAKLCDFEFARRCGCPSGRAGGTPFFQAPKV